MKPKCKTIAKKSFKNNSQNLQKILPKPSSADDFSQFVGKKVETEIDYHEDQSDMFELTIGQAKQSKIECHNSQKRIRSANPEVSKLEKHHAIGIINRMKLVLLKLEDYSHIPQFQKLLKILSQTNMRAKTKFLLLCILTSRLKCFEILGNALNHILKDKAKKLEARHEKNQKTLEIGRRSMNFYQSLLSLTRNNINSNLRSLIQDSMCRLYQLNEESCPNPTKNGLKKIRKQKLDQKMLVKQSLEAFGVSLDDDRNVSKSESLVFIQPNIRSTPLKKLTRLDVQDFEESFFINLDGDFS